MKNRLKTGLTLLLISALLASSVPARAAYDDLGASARVTGLGNAYTAVADDAYAVYYNPAGLALLSQPQLATTYSKLLTGLSDGSNLQNSFVGYAQPLKDGRWGAVGGGWDYLSLDSLYKENQLFGSYGRQAFADRMPGKFYWGFTAKFLSRGINPGAEATNPVGPTGIVQANVQDPALAHTSKTNIDEDLGFLWRIQPRWTLGLAVQHLLEPNIAFSPSETDKLGRNIKLGAAYRTPFSLLSGDLDFVTAPGGGKDKILSFGAEKWLPTLTFGTFGLRGSLGLGDRSYRQIGMGLSYRMRRLQFDYGFTVPLGGLGLSGNSGTHRVGLAFRFGTPREARPTFGAAMLENIRELDETGTAEFKAELDQLAAYTRKAVEEFLRQAKALMARGKFADALDKVDDAASLTPGDPKLEASRDRLRLSAGIFPEIADSATDAARGAIFDAITAFVAGEDQAAYVKANYAMSVNPGNARLELLRDLIARKTGAEVSASTAAAVPQVSTVTVYVPQVSTVTVYVPQVSTVTVYVPQTRPQGVMSKPELERIVDGDLEMIEIALRQGDNARAVKLSQEVLQLDPNNALAHKRAGIAYAALKNFPAALKALRSAYKLERDPQAKAKLRFYIDQLVPLLQKQNHGEDAQPAPTGQLTPQEIERLYDAGVELYAQGRLLEARKLFRRILEQDPKNISARRASDRIDSDILQGEKK